MADIRIKDISTTAAAAASDDYFAIDGATSDVRKLSAYNPVVNDVTLGASGPSVKASLAARAPAQGIVSTGVAGSTVANLPAFGTGDFTVAAVVNKSALTRNEQVIGGANGSYGLVIQTSGALICGKEGTAATTASTGVITTGKSFLVAYTRSGTTGTYYINGVAAGTTTDALDYSVASTIIGGSTANANSELTGFLRLVTIENRALSAAEILALAETGSVPPSDIPATPASNTSIISGAWTKAGTGTITSTGPDNFAISLSSAGDAFAGSTFAIKPGDKVKLSGSFSGITGNPVVFLYKPGVGQLSDAVSLTSTGATVTATSAVSGAYVAVDFSGAGTATGASVVVTTLGALLAPDATQPGAGGIWRDVSGNLAHITLGTGCGWALPSSGYYGGDATIAGDLALSDATATLTLGATNTGSLAVDADGALTITPAAGQNLNVKTASTLKLIPATTGSPTTQLWSINDTASSSSSFSFKRARGTVSSPTVALNGDTLGYFSFGGKRTGAATAYGEGAYVISVATADFSSYYSSSLKFGVCPAAATTSEDVLTIASSATTAAELTIGSANTATIAKSAAGALTITPKSGQSLLLAGGKLNIASLPTSAAGLSSGDIWANSNVLTVVP